MDVARAVYRRIWPRSLRGTRLTRTLQTGFVGVLHRFMGPQRVYDDAYFREAIEPTAQASAAAMAEAIIRDLAPRRVLDVGCGTGALLACFQERGCAAEGLERSHAALEFCRRRGVRARYFDIEAEAGEAIAPADIVLSFEVAEHLSPRSADRFVALLSSVADCVVMSAARPGQGGLDHLNEREPEYWAEKFLSHGFARDSSLCEAWRAEWATRGVAWWYHANLLVFRRVGVT